MSKRVRQAEKFSYVLASENQSIPPGGEAIIREERRVARIAVLRDIVAWLDQLGYGEIEDVDRDIDWGIPVVADIARDPDLARAAGDILRLATEVLAGRRPATQLAPLADSLVLRYLQGRGFALRGGARRGIGRVLSSHVSQPVEGVGELTALVLIGHDRRPRALTARIQLDGAVHAPEIIGGWRLVHLAVL
ncbi:Rv3235 family protein [Pseudonocardia tropica]|uniref:Rv3235 family protein n=1 Tax=Pseudonocardia tropica TaxID=681289 RepID=A0ABV1K571_9PSEU